MRSNSLLLCSVLLVGASAHGALAAGAVTVAPDGFGGTTITGDAVGNAISVSDVNSDNNWVVTGTGGTLVNGGASAQTGVLTGSIVIAMNDGDDSVKVSYGQIAQYLTIQLGTGNDKASLKSLLIGLYFHFEGNADADSLAIKEVTIGDPTDTYQSSIDMDDLMGGGTGDDKAKIGSMVEGSAAITLGGGNDKLTMVASSFVTGGLASFSVNAGGGTDKTTLKGIDAIALAVEMNAGDKDTLKMISCSATSNSITDSAGADDKFLSKLNTLGTAAMGTPSGFEF